MGAGPGGWQPDWPGDGDWPELGLALMLVSAVLVVAFVCWLIT